MPMVLRPPMRPKKVGRKGSLTGPPTRAWRTVLSTMKSSRAPQAKSATPAMGLPPRKSAGGYIRPPIDQQTFVPEKY